MQTAHVLLSLGGDHGNTVSKFNCTAAEIAVLIAIHGDDSVKDIEPQKTEIKRSHREERMRLLNIYGHAKTDERKPIVEGLFPGAAARVFENLNELNLDESFFKATGRLKASGDDRPLEAAYADETYVTTEAMVGEAEEGVGDDMSDSIAISARREERAREKDILG